MGEQAVKGKGSIACWRVAGLRSLMDDRRRVDPTSQLARRFASCHAEVVEFRRKRLAAVDFVSLEARDGALGHGEAVATIALALHRHLGETTPVDDLLLLAFLHDLGKHAIDSHRLNASALTTAQRGALVHDLLAATLDALPRLDVAHLREAVERLYRFESARGAPEDDRLVMVVAAADTYDALVAPKLYKGRSWSIAGTLEELLRMPHTGPIFQALAELMCPAGTTVALRTKTEILFR
jgi:HD-GYP domain-containing protein (c-di-GMP phosphodiesterase class II)